MLSDHLTDDEIRQCLSGEAIPHHFEAHLRHCPACQKRIRALEKQESKNKGESAKDAPESS